MAAMAEDASMEVEQEKEMGDDQSVMERIRSGVSARESYIKEHAESLTMASFRRLLEEDLGLEATSLDKHKRDINQLVDQIMEANNAKEEPESQEEEPEAHTNGTDVKENSGVSEEEPRKNSVKKSVDSDEEKAESRPKSSRKRKVVLSDDSEEEGLAEETSELSDKKPAKKKKSSKKASDEEAELSDSSDKKTPKKKATPKADSEDEAEKSDSSGKKPPKKKVSSKKPSEQESESDDASDQKPSKKKKKTVSKAPEPKPVQSKLAEKLKLMIKASGINIPPSIYKRVKQAPEAKRDDALIKELESILQKEGLDQHSSEKDIKAVKRKKDKQRDLEGIDVSNIITKGRGRRQQNDDFFEVPASAKSKRRKAVVSDDDDDDDD